MENYYVFMVYHKKGKYKIKTYESEEELEDFLIGYLKKYKEYAKIGLYESLYNLIHEAMKVGSIVLDEKKGYGVVKVVMGDEIQDDSDDEDDYIESSGEEEEEEVEEEEEEEEVEKV